MKKYKTKAKWSIQKMTRRGCQILLVICLLLSNSYIEAATEEKNFTYEVKEHLSNDGLTNELTLKLEQKENVTYQSIKIGDKNIPFVVDKENKNQIATYTAIANDEYTFVVTYTLKNEEQESETKIEKIEYNVSTIGEKAVQKEEQKEEVQKEEEQKEEQKQPVAIKGRSTIGVSSATYNVAPLSATAPITSVGQVTEANFPDPVFREAVIAQFDSIKAGSASLVIIGQNASMFGDPEKKIYSLKGLELIATNLIRISMGNNRIFEVPNLSSTGALFDIVDDGQEAYVPVNYDKASGTYVSVKQYTFHHGYGSNTTDFLPGYNATTRRITFSSMSDKQRFEIGFGMGDVDFQTAGPAGTVQPIIAINDTNFPVPKVKAIATNADTDRDGALSPTELQSIGAIDLYGRSLTSVAGIEHFTSVKNLYLGDNDLTSLDVSKLVALKKLDFSNNKIRSIDLSKNSVLDEVYGRDNFIVDFKLPTHQMTSVYIDNNEVWLVNRGFKPVNVTYDADKNKFVTDWQFGSNIEPSTVVFRSDILTGYGAEVNSDHKVTFSKSIRREDYFEYEFKKPTNVTNFQSMARVYLGGAKGDLDELIDINETNFPDPLFLAEIAKADANKDSKLATFSEASKIKDINLDRKTAVTTLKGIEYCKWLKELSVQGCSLTSVDISMLNYLTTLDLSEQAGDTLTGDNIKFPTGSADLFYLDLTGIKLGTIDLSNWSKLSQLYLQRCGLTNLDVSKNTTLLILYCDNNHLSYIKGRDKLTDSRFTMTGKGQTITIKMAVDEADGNWKGGFPNGNFGNTYTGLGNGTTTGVAHDGSKGIFWQYQKTASSTLDFATASSVLPGTGLQGRITFTSDKWFKPVTGINTTIPSYIKINTPTALSATTLPADGPMQTVTWSVTNANGTGATITGNKLTATSAGTITITATVKNGIVNGNYTKNYDVPIKEGVDFNETNFPDPKFRAFLASKNVDSITKDGFLERAELDAVKTISDKDYTVATIDSYKGIEHFTKLTELYLGDAEHPETLDISKNTALTKLTIVGKRGNMKSVDISKNIELKNLILGLVTIPTKDHLKTLTKLESLEIDDSTIAGGTLNVSANTNLTALLLRGCALTSLDVSMLTKLTSLDLDTNNLTTLDVTKNTALQTLKVLSNNLEFFDVTKNIALTSLNVRSNKFTRFDISKLSALQAFDGSNQTPTIGVSFSTGIGWINQTVKFPDDVTFGDATVKIKDIGGTNWLVSTHQKNGKTSSFTSKLPKNATATVSNTTLSGTVTLSSTTDHVPVNVITLPTTYPTIVVVNSLDLTKATIAPNGVSYTDIVWTMKNANGTGASISNNKVGATNAGTATITATIVNGKTNSGDFTQDFTITFENGLLLNTTNFPDSVFLAKLQSFDLNRDGYLGNSEIAKITELNFGSASGLTDLTGIQYLTSLTKLTATGATLSKIDLTKNVALTELQLLNTKLPGTTIDLSKNIELSAFNLSSTGIKTLDLSNNKKLTAINAIDNALTSITLPDLSASSVSELVLNIQNNQLTSLDLNPVKDKLRLLTCSGNKLSALDISQCTKLATLTATGQKPNLVNTKNIGTGAKHVNTTTAMGNGTVSFTNPKIKYVGSNKIEISKMTAALDNEPFSTTLTKASGATVATPTLSGTMKFISNSAYYVPVTGITCISNTANTRGALSYIGNILGLEMVGNPTLSLDDVDWTIINDGGTGMTLTDPHGDALIMFTDQGTARVKATIIDGTVDGNYEQEIDIIVSRMSSDSIADFQIVRGTAGNDGWYQSDVTVKSGDSSMKIATAYDSTKTNYQDTLTYSREGIHTNTIYLMDNSESLFEGKDLELKIDKTNPTFDATSGDVETTRNNKTITVSDAYLKSVKLYTADSSAGLDGVAPTTQTITGDAGSKTSSVTLTADKTKDQYFKIIAEDESGRTSTLTYTIIAPTYSLSVDAVNFAALTYGYSSVTQQALTFTDSGNTTATISSVTISDGAAYFEVIGSGRASKVAPKTGLNAGTYTGKVKVTYDDNKTIEANLSITINKAVNPFTATLASTIYHGTTYAPTITNKPAGSTGTYTIKYKKRGEAASTEVTESPKENGLYTATVYAVVDNYVNKEIALDYEIKYLDSTGLTLQVSGTKGNDPWYTSKMTVTAPTGYKLSETVDGTYEQSLEFMDMKKDATFSLRDDDTNATTDAVIAQKLYVDTIKPEITGIENNKEVVSDQNATVTIADVNLAKVTVKSASKKADLDGAIPVESSDFTVVDGKKKGTVVVEAKTSDTYYRVSGIDEAGNTQTYDYAILTPVYKVSAQNIVFDAVDYQYTVPTAKKSTLDLKASGANAEATITKSSLKAGETNFTITADGAVQPITGLSAGTYTTTITFEYNGGLHVDANVTFVVNRIENTFSIHATDKTYDKTAITASISGQKEDATATFAYKKEGDTTYTNGLPKDAGKYTIQASTSETRNYAITSKTTDVEITKATNVFDITTGDKDYDTQALVGAVGAINEGANVAFSYAVKEEHPSFGLNAPTNAGEYIIKAESVATANYLATTITKNVTIRKIENDFTIEQNNIAFGVSVDTKVNGVKEGASSTLEYKLETDADSKYTGTKPTTVGKYMVRVISEATTNYLETTKTISFEIGKINNPFTLVMGNVEYKQAITPSVENLGEGAEIAYSYKKKDADDKTYTPTKPVNAGEYTVRAVSKATTSYGVTTKTKDFTIKKIKNPLGVAQVDVDYKVALSPTVKDVAESADITYSYKLRSASDYSPTVPSDVGKYDLKAVSKETTNYLETVATTTFEIKRIANGFKVVMEDIYFGEALNPSAKNVDEHATIAYSYKVKGADDTTYTNTKPSAVGSYVVKGVSGETTNYQSTSDEKAFDIKKTRNVFTIKLDDVSYLEVFEPTVTDAYENPDFVYEYKKKDADDKTYTQEKPVNAGEYTVRATSSETANYAESTTTKDFKIKRIKNTPTLHMAAHEYGSTLNPSVEGQQENPSIVYSYKKASEGDDTYTSEEPKQPGEYTIKATLSQTVNYQETSVDQAFKIYPKVVAKDKILHKADALTIRTLEDLKDVNKVAIQPGGNVDDVVVTCDDFAKLQEGAIGSYIVSYKLDESIATVTIQIIADEYEIGEEGSEAIRAKNVKLAKSDARTIRHDELMEKLQVSVLHADGSAGDTKDVEVDLDTIHQATLGVHTIEVTYKKAKQSVEVTVLDDTPTVLVAIPSKIDFKKTKGSETYEAESVQTISIAPQTDMNVFDKDIVVYSASTFTLYNETKENFEAQVFNASNKAHNAKEALMKLNKNQRQLDFYVRLTKQLANSKGTYKGTMKFDIRYGE